MKLSIVATFCTCTNLRFPEKPLFSGRDSGNVVLVIWIQGDIYDMVCHGRPLHLASETSLAELGGLEGEAREVSAMVSQVVACYASASCFSIQPKLPAQWGTIALYEFEI